MNAEQKQSLLVGVTMLMAHDYGLAKSAYADELTTVRKQYADEHSARLAAEDALAILRARVQAIAHTAATARVDDAAGAVVVMTIADMLVKALEVGK